MLKTKRDNTFFSEVLILLLLFLFFDKCLFFEKIISQVIKQQI